MTATWASVAIEAAKSVNGFPQLNSGLLAIVIGLLTLLFKNQLDNRKLTIGANGEVRKEVLEQLGELRRDNETLRDEIRVLRRENDQLRDEVRGLHAVIDGLRRENLTAQLSTQRVLADQIVTTPVIDRALRDLGSAT